MRLRLSITLDVTRDREQGEDRETERMRETVLDAYVEHAPERPVFGFQPRVTEEGRG